MKFFVDTANVEDIKKANDMGVICGVTTNPSLIAKEGRDFNEVIKEITSIVDGPISGEVKATTVDAEGMIKEGRQIASIHPNMVVKIPMTVEGLKAVKVLSSEGIKTNVTLIFSANQAILAANAGATYVSPFLGRLDDIFQIAFCVGNIVFFLFIADDERDGFLIELLSFGRECECIVACGLLLQISFFVCGIYDVSPEVLVMRISYSEGLHLVELHLAYFVGFFASQEFYQCLALDGHLRLNHSCNQLM